VICINCGSVFQRQPFQYYFCSKMCWEDAKISTPWRILSDGFGPLMPAVRLTASARYPRLAWSSRSARRPDRMEVPVGMLQQHGLPAGSVFVGPRET
jgi:hypothetical protein